MGVSAGVDTARPRAEIGGRLEGKVALVTGGGLSGTAINIGHAVAVLFASQGARVVIFDKDAGAAEATVAVIARDRGDACAVVGDLSKESDCRLAVQSAIKRHGALHVLVNNIGLGGARRSSSLADWDLLMSVNVKGTAMLSQHAVAAMLEHNGDRGPRGVIVNLSSISATRPAGVSTYAVSKAAVEGITRMFAAEYGRQGIRVNCVRPGQVWTPMIERGHEPATWKQTLEYFRAGRLLPLDGNAWDIAYAVLYLASDEARWVTGQVLTVDGGFELVRPQLPGGSR